MTLSPAAWRASLLLAAFVAGALGALGLAPIYAWYATVAMFLAVPFALRRCTTAWQAAWVGLAMGTGWFGLGLSWIVEPFFVDAARHGWMAPFALLFISVGMALFWGAAFWAAYRLGRGFHQRVWLLCLTWTLAELARGYILTGFPWASPPQVWVGEPPMLFLAWVGPYGLFLWMLAVLLPFGAWMQAILSRERPRALYAMPLALYGIAQTLVGYAQPEVVSSGYVVRVVQPNAEQHLKWDRNFMPVFFNRQIEYTEAAGDGPRPDLIVWPETAITPLLDQAEYELGRIAQAANGVPLVLGTQRADYGTDRARYYNTLVVLDETGAVADTYDKHHLVPFGEYLPFGNVLSRFGIRGLAEMAAFGYSPGPGPALVDLGPVGQAVPLICYEAVFPQDVNGAPGRADVLLQVTNDAWFGKRSGPYQHLAQAQMRAAEQGLPMIRAANTGVSAVIDPLGRIVTHIPLGEQGFADATLPSPFTPTIYARFGDFPVFLAVLALILMSMMRIMGRNRNT
ncbi:apolipoprotein N-acyltransferase [Chachezhania antarctica]|uniref:apolipoprotein N-acyltransferase n=1 Tax=Chachezhania antarctica TaxID=2340860 RepID=UPI001F08E746|nr:apolipoprotein N-acyltransferase [Chachezhania antarctica]